MRTFCLLIVTFIAAVNAQQTYGPFMGPPFPPSVEPISREPTEFPFTGPYTEAPHTWPTIPPVTVKPGLPANPGKPVNPGRPVLWKGWPQRQQDREEQDIESLEEIESEYEDAPDAQEAPDAQDVAGAGAGQSGEAAGGPANFLNFGGKPFKGFKKPTKADAKQITGKTIGIILSTLFLVAAAAVVAVIIVRKKQSA